MSDQSNPRAFPSAAIDDAYGGMPLRDWFAGQALAANADNPAEWSHRMVAEDCYAYADAMMAERLKGNAI